MRNFCAFCSKVHEDSNWKYTPLETEFGVKYAHICSKFFKPSQKEWIPERIKNDRVKYFNSLVQPYRGDTPSSEYIEAHGTKNFTPDEVKRAKPVWTELKGHATRKKSI